MLFQFGEFELDDQRLTLSGPAGPIHLEPQVFGVLHYLIVHRDRVVSKEELLDKVWGNRFVSESALTSRVKAVRRAVGDDGSEQRVIRTAHGQGYRFVADLTTATTGVNRRPLARLRSTLIGRDKDSKGVVDLIRDQALVTVAGPGGVGKTTLALAVAHQLQSEYADGAVFVDLAPVPLAGDVTRAVADAAGIEGDAARSLTSVADHLADRPLLLVLDNCEHVLVSSAALVDRMLAAGGAIRVLATSREPLRVLGEHVWPLGPLTTEGPELFAERARAAEPRITWDPADPRVVEICRRLDNVPLALELAAGQLRRFSLDELAERLASRLTLLSQRAVGDSRRHATLEATIDWSYQLLDAAEQRLLRHLAVFPAYFGVPAVESSAPPDVPAVAGVLGELVDKSLVVREPGADRYRLLETIRVFGQSLLDEAGETAAAMERHRQYVLQRMRSRSRLDRWMSALLASEFRQDLDSARQAFQLSADAGDADAAVEIALGGSFLWRNAVGCAEGREWIDQLNSQPMDRSNRHWLYLLEADIGLGVGDFHEMSRAAMAARELAADSSDPAAIGLSALYVALAKLTDPDQVTARLTVAIELARSAGDPRLVVLNRAFLAGAALAAGDHDDARLSIEDLDQVASEDGYDRFIVHWVGWMLATAERDAAATQHWMAAQQDFLDRTGVAETWLSTFSSTMTQVVAGGEYRDRLRRTLALADREGYQAEADCVLILAYAELCAGRFDAAAELMGTAVASRFNTTAHYMFYRVVLDHSVRRHLDADAMHEAIERGRRRTAAEVLEEYGAPTR